MLVPDRFQFRRGEPGEIVKSNITLERYCEILQAFPFDVKPKTQTLWIPFNSSNRTVSLGLDHGINGFNNKGFLTGFNGNCNTSYIVIIVPMYWDYDKVKQIGKLVLAKKGIDIDEMRDNHFRILNAHNIDLIIEVINEHKEFH